MEKDSRQEAYNYLINLAHKQEYVTFDQIMDCADDYSLSIQDFDWLSNSLTTRGIIIYSEAPSAASLVEDEEFDDFSQCNYDAVYSRIIELSPSLESFVNKVKNIVPPQRQEIKQLKYQIVDGNEYARNRMIEMHLRIALRIALQRSEAYNMDIEDAVGYAYIGLIIAVDKYDPDTSGAFASYATLWILQNISREQSTRRPLIYYPVHQKDNFFTMYPILKQYGCLECDKLLKCKKVREMVVERLQCSEKDADQTIEQMIPDYRITDLLNDSNIDEIEIGCSPAIDTVLGRLSSETVISSDDTFEEVYTKNLSEVISNMLSNLKPREEEIIRLRYGFNGPEQTLEQVGNKFNITRERVRQIEAKVVRNLSHPSKSKILKELLI